MLEKLKDQYMVMWVVAFIGVSVLVGLGKLKPETIEFLLFAMGGAAVANKTKKEGP